MDSGIIMSDGLITDPIDQIKVFMKPPKTPSFQRILDVYWEQLNLMHELFLSSGASLVLDKKKSLVGSCEQVVKDIKRWAERGFPIDRDLVREQEKVAEDIPIPDVVSVEDCHPDVVDHEPVESNRFRARAAHGGVPQNLFGRDQLRKLQHPHQQKRHHRNNYTGLD